MALDTWSIVNLIVLSLLLLVCVVVCVAWQFKNRSVIRWDHLLVYHDLISTSPFVSPLVLLLFRACCVIFSTTIVIYALSVKGATFFEFYTQWNFTLLCVYFWLVSYFSFRKAVLHIEKKLNSVEHLLASVAWVVFHMEFVLGFFIDIVVWVILLPLAAIYDNKHDEDLVGKDFLTVISFSAHLCNFVMMFIEFCFNRFPFVLHHCCFLVIWTSIYVVFAWIYHYVSDATTWTYPFLNLASRAAIGIYIALLLLILLFHWISYLIHRKTKAHHCSPPDSTDGTEAASDPLLDPKDPVDKTLLP